MCIYIDAPIYKYRNVGRASWAGRYPRALEELPFHLTQSRGWSRLEEVLLDLRFIEGKFRQQMGHDLLQDFVLAVQAKAPEAAKSGRWGVVPVCNLTVCNGRLCRPEAAKTGR